jgi:hypothetical protein
VQSWQQYFEDLVRWFTDRAIEAAVKAGRLGGLDRFPEDGPVSEMRLHEAEGRAAMEKRTGKDLSYEFVMPFPGRRQLPEVQAFVQALGQSMDPNGVNVPLRRHLLRFAFEQMGIDDVGRAVDECLPEEGIPGGIGPQTDDVIDPETGLPQTNPDGSPKKVLATIPGGGPGGRGDGAGPGGERPPNVRRSTAADGKRPVSEQEWIPAELRPELEQFTAGSDSMFSRFVSEPAVLAALQLAGSSNGDGAGH